MRIIKDTRENFNIPLIKKESITEKSVIELYNSNK